VEGAHRADEPGDRGHLTDPAALWSGATYERVAETFGPIYARVVGALEPAAGERYLDVACGTGDVAILAARAGAEATGLDISADQLGKARAAAAAAGLTIRFDEGDVQELPYGAGEFDAVSSTFGLIFAPDHERVAAGLARVCRPGGRLAITSWPDDDWWRLGVELGRIDATDLDARSWAHEGHVRGLLDASFDLRFEPGTWTIEAGSAEELWELVAESVPPIRHWLEGLEPARRAEVDAAYLEFLAGGKLTRTYRLVLGARR
jgi:ubiquinone/menaquinone biosynthesis C-methylase UbiE